MAVAVVLAVPAVADDESKQLALVIRLIESRFERVPYRIAETIERQCAAGAYSKEMAVALHGWINSELFGGRSHGPVASSLRNAAQALARLTGT